jgi:phosphoglycerate dehydrogenase-like enzyme
MADRQVVVFNVREHGERLAELTRALPVEIRHATFDLPWEEIAARRAGRPGGGTAPAEIAEVLRAAEAILGFALPLRTAELAPALRWVETPATGFDQLAGTGVLERRDVTVTTVGGLFAPWVAEHAFALLLGLTRQIDRFAAAQRRREWLGRGTAVRELRDATMAIVGLGNIGRAVARAAKAFGMRVIGTRRNVAEVPPEVDRVYPPAELHAMLGAADVVVLAVAGTPETARLIGAAELAAMRREALLINVARGMVIDEVALAEALAQGQIAGAGLDVFTEEPLPAASPLWTLPNVLITPHIAVNVPSKLRRCVEHFAENVRRYCAGDALLDRVHHKDTKAQRRSD